MKKSQEDTRPHWSDPDLRCWYGRKTGGFTSATVQALANKAMKDPSHCEWCCDPAYNWRQQARKK